MNSLRFQSTRLGGIGKLLSYRNPLGAQPVQNLLRSTSVALTQESQVLLSDFVTTATTRQNVIAGLAIAVPAGASSIFPAVNGALQHTVAGARVTLFLEIYNPDLVVGYVMRVITNLYVPAANEWIAFHIATGLSVPLNLPNITRPGKPLLYFIVRNETAGTLTIRGQNSSDGTIMFAFVAGDSNL